MVQYYFKLIEEIFIFFTEYTLAIMDQCQELNQMFLLLLLLMMIIKATNAISTDSIFKMVDEGQNVFGNIGTELIVKTNIQCSMM